jgi:hypothetical protein
MSCRAATRDSLAPSHFVIVAPLGRDYLGMGIAGLPDNRFLERYPNAPQRVRVEQLRVQAIGK